MGNFILTAGVLTFVGGLAASLSSDLTIGLAGTVVAMGSGVLLVEGGKLVYNGLYKSSAPEWYQSHLYLMCLENKQFHEGSPASIL